MGVGGWSHHATATLLLPTRPSIRCTGGWVGPRAVWTFADNLAHTGFDIRTVQPVASRYTDCTITTDVFGAGLHVHQKN
jgi:hypothetical protein